MYAQAGIIGRVARERTEKQRKRYSQVQLPSDAESQVSGDISEATPHRCFLPCMRGPSILSGVALLLLVLGGILCNFAFHAKTYSQIMVNGGNNTVNLSTNKKLYHGLQSLSYLGPISMGMGVFLIIVVCVTVFEKRETIMKDAVKRKVEMDQQLKIEYSYKIALENLKSAGGRSGDVEVIAEDTHSLLQPSYNEHGEPPVSHNVDYPSHSEETQAFINKKCASEPTAAPASYSLYHTDLEDHPPSTQKETSNASNHSLLPSDIELCCITDSRLQSSEQLDQVDNSQYVKLYCGCMENLGYEQSSYSLRNPGGLVPLNSDTNLPAGNSQGVPTLKNLAKLTLILQHEQSTQL